MADGPKHLMQRHDGRPATIACMSRVEHPWQYTDAPLKASCKKCSRLAEGLTDDVRTDIWQNANDRLGKESLSPWEKAAKKKARAAAKAAKKAAA